MTSSKTVSQTARRLLGDNQQAAGGEEWGRVRALHLKCAIRQGGLNGTLEQWQDAITGRYAQAHRLGITAGGEGFDGTLPWSQDVSGHPRPEENGDAEEAAANTAYRTCLGWWYPQRWGAKTEYVGQAQDGDHPCHVLRLTPDGGRPFDLWLDAATALTARTVEQGAFETVTRFFSDYRAIGGVRLPFRVRTSNGHTRYDQECQVERVELNPPGVEAHLRIPPPPPPDFQIAGGEDSVEVPFRQVGNLIVVGVSVNGSTFLPFILDTGGVNLVTPEAAQELGLEPQGAFWGLGGGEEAVDMRAAAVSSLEFGGVRLCDQVVWVYPFPDLKEALGLAELGGLLGYEVFRRLVVRVDYQHQRLTLTRPDRFSYGGGGTVVPFRFHGNIPEVEGALDGVAGVDLNPFAVEVARFRLLLAALHAAGIARLAAAPDFRMKVAVGDSLLHGTHFFRGELGAGDQFGRRVRAHAFAAEDLAEATAILGRQYHAVVGNPPYIGPQDAAMRAAYRDIYTGCYRAYGLGVPFTERFFDLALRGTAERAAGFVGLIVANNFMKREFGAKLIEQVLPALDLTHVVDCSGAYIPGHGTPTVILFGRNRLPLERVVRTVRRIDGEPGTPDDPAKGQVWTAILAQTDATGSATRFISVEDTARAVLANHPWNMGGGGASDVQATAETGRAKLADQVQAIGFGSVTREDDAYLLPASALRRSGLTLDYIKHMVEGEDVRDFLVGYRSSAIWPYDSGDLAAKCTQAAFFLLWPVRSILQSRVAYGLTQIERDLSWFEYSMFFKQRYRSPLTIAFAEVATHNHFVLDRGGKVFNRTAPVIKLPAGTSEDVHLGLLGLLNSSTACFWLKAVCTDKAAKGGGSANDEAWRSSRAFNSSNVGRFPLASDPPLDLAQALDTQAQRLAAHLPAALCARATPTAETLATARAEAEAARAAMVALQEELDWRCYRLYALLDDAPEHPDPPPLQLGQRAFEIVMARRMEAGLLDTAWFARHRSTPITELPAHWPPGYRAAVERRIALIEANPTIALIERPEHKRRWASTPWEEQEQDSLRTWLLDRLETPHYWPRDQPAIQTTRSLADLARRDADFCAVAALYDPAAAAKLDTLVATLVQREAVPFLAALRYTATGLRKRADWEDTWDRQRREDAIDAAVAAERSTFAACALAELGPLDPAAVEARTAFLVAAEQKRRKEEEVGRIPVPPKYKTPDFQHVDLWRLRGGLDVPKERFVSFPGAAPDADGTLPVLWAGHGHLPRAQALAIWTMERREQDGWPAARLAPLLAGLLELVPWLRQWHNGIDEDTGLRMGDYYAEFVADQARTLELTPDGLRGWTPPAPVRRGRKPGAAA